MAVRASFTSRLSTSWREKKEKNYDLIALQMATDVDRIAKVTAPKDTRNLVNSGRIDRVAEAVYEVLFGGDFGGANVPYARIQELGGWTGRNHASFITGKHFLENAGDGVAKQKKKYLSGKV